MGAENFLGPLDTILYVNPALVSIPIIYTNGAISKSSCAFMVCKVKWVLNIFFIVTEEPLASGAIMSCSFCK